MKPWYLQRTVWSAVIAALLALPSIVEQAAPFLNPEQRRQAAALAAIVAGVSAIFARAGGVKAAADAAGERDA